jgi:hypothetical protein
MPTTSWSPPLRGRCSKVTSSRAWQNSSPAAGLELSEAKTSIVHIDDGFDFLGFNLRHFPNGKLLVRPQKGKVALHRRRLSAFYRANRQMPTAEVIKQLSPVREASHFHRIHLLQRQAGRCAACKTIFDPDLEQSASVQVHRWCHPGRAPRSSSKGAGRS